MEIIKKFQKIFKRYNRDFKKINLLSQMEKNQVIMIDNYRFMHGRNKINGKSKKRNNKFSNINNKFLNINI